MCTYLKMTHLAKVNKLIYEQELTGTVLYFWQLRKKKAE